MTANDKTSVGNGTGSYKTPDDLFQTYNRRWQFNFDAWAEHWNAQCQEYATEQGTFTKAFIPSPHPVPVHDLDGFGVSWKGKRVWGNPPYTRGLIDRCVEKFVTEVTKPEAQAPECAVYLVPASTETDWFNALIDVCGMPLFLRRRVHFIHPPYPCKPILVSYVGDQQVYKQQCAHELGVPLKNPPSGMAVFEARARVA